MKKLLVVYWLLGLPILFTSCSLGGSYQLGTLQIPMILIYAVMGVALWIKLKNNKKKKG